MQTRRLPPNMFELTPEGWITTVEMCMPDLEGGRGRATAEGQTA